MIVVMLSKPVKTQEKRRTLPQINTDYTDLKKAKNFPRINADCRGSERWNANRPKTDYIKADSMIFNGATQISI
jgi:hypothetical protein